MTLNLLVTFRSGKPQVILGVDYERIQQQLETKAAAGVIVDVEVLPDDKRECDNALRNLRISLFRVPRGENYGADKPV